MKTSIDKALGQTLIEASVARERQRERERDAPDELWTLAVTQRLVEHLPRLTLPDAEFGLERSDPDGSSQVATATDTHSGGGEPPEELGTIGPLGPERAEKTAASQAHGLPAKLRAEVSDERLGRLELSVERGERGLDIVINVADAHVKALIMAEQAILMKTLKDAGLHVASVQIGTPSRAGTGLAVDREEAERPRRVASFRQPSARRRTYPGSLEDEDDADSEGLDFTA